MRRVLASELVALVVLGVATAVATRPALRPGTGFGQYDSQFTHAAVEHLQDVVLHGAPWRDAPLGWPLHGGTAQADWMAGQALLGLPLRLADLDPGRAALLLSLLGVALTAWAGHRVAAALLGRGPHTWIAGVIAGAGPAQLAHLHHVNLVHHEWMLLAALATGAGIARDRPGLAAAGGLLGALAFHFGVYSGVHASLATACVAVAMAGRGSRRAWAGLAAGVAIGAVTVVPVLAFYRQESARLGASLDPGEIVAQSWDPATALQPTAGAWLHERLFGAPELAKGTSPPGPGIVAALLGLVGIGTVWKGDRRAWAAVAATLVLGGLLAMGPSPSIGGRSVGVPGPYAILAGLPGLESLREPERWLAVATAALGMFAAAGLAWATRRLGPVAATAVSLVAVALVLGELPAARVIALDELRAPPIYRRLADVAGDGAILDLRLARRGTCACTPALQRRLALFHGRPLAGGQFARRVQALADIDGRTALWPASADYVANLGVVAVIEHPPLAPTTPAGWTCVEEGGHRLCTRDGGIALGATDLPAFPPRDRAIAAYPAWMNARLPPGPRPRQGPGPSGR